MNRRLTGRLLGAAASSITAVWRPLAPILVSASLLALTLPPTATRAATFNPASTSDLIAAIVTANANGEDDIIDLGGGTFTLTSAFGAGSFGGSIGLPTIGADSGHKLSIRNGTIGRDTSGAAFRIFQVAGGADLTLDSVTVTGGDAPAGGGVLSFGKLTLVGSTFHHNTGSSSGGGIYATGDTLTVTNSTIRDNAGGSGGGIFLESAATAVLTNSTSSGNTGGGIWNSSSVATLINSTVSGNSGIQGGGIASSGNNSTTFTTLINSTVSGNTTGFQGANLNALTGTMKLRATIIGTSSGGPNCGGDSRYGRFVSLGSNVADDASCFANAGTDQVVADVGLGPLQNNGGPTQTRALQDGSPAIDAVQGLCTDTGLVGGAAITTDQRGRPRPAGLRCDAGAVERQGGVLQLSGTSYAVNEGAGTATITISRSGGTEGAVGATLTPSDGTATAPADYDNAPLMVSFADGDSAPKAVSIPIVNDVLSEANETVNLTLAAPTGGAGLGAEASAVLTITDDDPAPTPTFTPTATATATGTSTATATGTPPATPTFTPTTTMTATQTPVPTSTATATATATATPVPPAPPRDENKEDSPRTVTEEQRQQQQHTNTGNRDDVATEGNVVEVTRTTDGLTIVVANADGLVTVVYPCGTSCPTIRVGDYVQVDGTKENEQLYQADEVTVTR